MFSLPAPSLRIGCAKAGPLCLTKHSVLFLRVFSVEGSGITAVTNQGKVLSDTEAYRKRCRLRESQLYHQMVDREQMYHSVTSPLPPFQFVVGLEDNSADS